MSMSMCTGTAGGVSMGTAGGVFMGTAGGVFIGTAGGVGSTDPSLADGVHTVGVMVVVVVVVMVMVVVVVVVVVMVLVLVMVIRMSMLMSMPSIALHAREGGDVRWGRNDMTLGLQSFNLNHAVHVHVHV